ncbi:MAG: HEPN domain-containing protein [Clostridiales bacterium]|jgi:HEPN domain-containing protein|nr:HEPN domain-containing protein [Clostridiales bacterium]
MSDNSAYWLGLSDYDIETAKAMRKTGRYLYVGFMCHQVIEKALKAAIAKNCAEGAISPKIHHLLKLADRAGLFEKMSSEQQAFIKELNSLNIEARYPEYKEQIAEELSAEICDTLIVETEELQCWIKAQL